MTALACLWVIVAVLLGVGLRNAEGGDRYVHPNDLRRSISANEKMIQRFRERQARSSAEDPSLSERIQRLEAENELLWDRLYGIRPSVASTPLRKGDVEESVRGDARQPEQP